MVDSTAGTHNVSGGAPARGGTQGLASCFQGFRSFDSVVWGFEGFRILALFGVPALMELSTARVA